MLLGILSDTHDELENAERAINDLLHRGAQAIAHCGDITSPRIIQICSVLPAYFVFGNHDADLVPELESIAERCGATCLGWGGIFEIHDRQIAMAHGHLTMDITPLLEREPHFLLTGHSHEPSEWMQGNVRRICPGALHRAETLTYAMLNLETGGLEIIPLN